MIERFETGGLFLETALRKKRPGSINALFPACNPCVETAVWAGLTGSAICLLSMRGNSAFWSEGGAVITLLTVSSPFVEDTNIGFTPDLKDVIPPFQLPPNFTLHGECNFCAMYFLFTLKHN
ncbi:MAG: hypothetical protein J7M20_07590 [Deltaproteobacteria bacterium]|nr:hypothetical protein [Deltaproteobacteria bacterium]